MKNLQFFQSSASKLNQSSFSNLRHQTQLQIVFEYLQQRVVTASMLAKATGIPQKNICRYKRKLEKAGLLWEVYHYRCKVTGKNAWYITTDQNRTIRKSVIQLKLF